MRRKTRKHLYYNAKRDYWVVDGGGRHRRLRKYFPTRREAEQFMESDAYLIAAGLKKAPDIETPDFKPSLSVDEATKWYLDNVTATQKSRYSQIWEPMCFRKFTDYFQHKKLYEIGLAELLEYQSYLKNREHLAPQTVNRRFNSIRSFFRTFEETRGIPNPCRKLKSLKVAESKQYDVLDESEMNQLILAAKPWLRPIIHVANITGMRRSDLINLRFPAVNLEERYLVVEMSEGFETKNKKSRRLPLTEELVKIFSSPVLEARRTGRTGPNDYLFVDDEGRNISADRLTKVMRKLMKRILGRTHGGVHIIRHSALTAMIRHGADVESVRKIAGHSSLTVTQRYLKAGDDQMRRAMSRSNSPIFGGSVATGGDKQKMGAIR